MALFSFLDNNYKNKDKPPNIIAEMIHFLFIHHLMILPLLVRIFSLGESMKYNYHHISRKFYDDNFQSEQDEHFRNKFYVRNFYYMKLFVVPLVITFALSAMFILIPFTRCSLKATIYSLYRLKIKVCDGEEVQDPYMYELVGGIITNFYLMFEMCVFITLLFRVFKFPINVDKFYLKLEFLSLFFVWLVSNNFILGILYVSNISFCASVIYTINSIRNGLIVLIYALVTLIRKKITNNDIINMIKDFDSFMYCHISFSFFKDYIKNYHEDDYKLLSFWIEYHLFKKQAQNNQDIIREICIRKEEEDRNKIRTSSVLSQEASRGNLSINSEERQMIGQGEEVLKELAECIFIDYFTQNPSSSPSSNNYMQIEFPVDIFEKVEDVYRKNFNIENLDEIFDEAYTFVSSRLFNLFLTFLRDETEYRKLERIIFFIDFYEIKRIAVN